MHVRRIQDLFDFAAVYTPATLLALAQQVSLQVQYMVENLAVCQMLNYASESLQNEMGKWPERYEDIPEKHAAYWAEHFGPGLHFVSHELALTR